MPCTKCRQPGHNINTCPSNCDIDFLEIKVIFNELLKTLENVNKAVQDFKSENISKNKIYKKKAMSSEKA